MTQLSEKKIKAPKTLLILLIVLALAGNALKVPFFFGVEFIFGSIAVLVATSTFGPTWGVLSAILPAVQTYLIWKHPYAGIVLIFEAAFVGIVLQRLRLNLALAGLSYWILIGIPSVFLLYHFLLLWEQPEALFAALKQGSNGVANAIFASLLVTYVPWIRDCQRGRDSRIGLFETVFNIFIAAALIPAFILLNIDAKRAVKEVEQDTRSKLSAITSGISISLIRWREEHIRSISLLARVIENIGLKDRARMQILLIEHHKSWSNFHGTFVTNKDGVTLAFEPLVNARGESTIGISFADRDYFQTLKKGAPSPFISPVFMARGGIFEPVFNIANAMQSNGKFAGIVAGSLNLDDVKKILSDVAIDVEYTATLLDAKGQVMASTMPDLKPLDARAKQIHIRSPIENDGIFYNWSDEKDLPPISRWRKSSIGQTIEIPGIGSWSLIIEIPLVSQQAPLYQRYSRILSLFLILAFVLLITSQQVAGSISRPLVQLSRETTDIPERIRLDQSIGWPSSRLLEVSVLVQNFQSAVEALKRRFIDLETSKSQLDQANRTKDEFLSIASHELKTPLTPLKMQIQLLRMTLERGGIQALDPKKVGRSLDLADLQITRISRLIDDLLDVARINAGKLKLAFEKVNLAELIREVVERYNPHLNAAGCKIILQAPTYLYANVDPLRIEQVVVNLLTNAAKYAPGKPVEISLFSDQDNAVLLVKDSGPGIPKEAHERIFGRFERVVSKAVVGGLGLGLFISRQIVEAHGGRIELDSQAGKGSTFTVTIPLGNDKKA